jgi:hypothetical protein
VAIHFHAFLTSGLDEGERSASLSGRSIPSEKLLIAFGKKSWIGFSWFRKARKLGS